VAVDAAARKMADAGGVDVRLYTIIYKLIEDIDKALKGMLEPEERETILGRAQVRAVFRISKVGNIAGSHVMDGEIRRNARVRVTRNNEVLHQGEISSLKHLQEDVREVRQGFDCGIAVRGFNDFNEGDIIECFIVEKVQVV